MPMKSVFLALSLVSTLAVPAAMANERYRERPPVVVSPDLSAPWVTQLGGRGNVRPVVYPRAPAARQPLFQQRQAAAMPQRPSSGVTSQRPARVQNAAVRPNAPVRTQIAPQFLPQIVSYDTAEKPGTIVIDTPNRFLYLVLADGKARRYGVGVGKPGFEWAGTHKVTRKAEWPSWTPPKEMITREAAKGHYLPAFMEGGPANPMGARAMYLGSNSLPHSRHQPALDDRQQQFLRLHPHAQRGCHRSLRARECGNQGHSDMMATVQSFRPLQGRNGGVSA